MSRSTLALLIFLVSFTALAQPGLCPCWLFADVGKYHPHPDGHPGRPHSHAYLFELYNSQTVASTPSLPTPARALILALALGALWLYVAHTTVAILGWAAHPPIPPPRLAPAA